MKIDTILETLAIIAPPLALALQKYAGNKKDIKQSEFQNFLLIHMITGNDKREELLEGMQTLLSNHMIHEIEVMTEMVQALKNLRVDMIRRGLV